MNPPSIDGSTQSVEKYKFGSEANEKSRFSEEYTLLERSRNKKIKHEKHENVQIKELSLA